MQRIFSRKRKDYYGLFASALAFGFTAVMATVLFSNAPADNNAAFGAVRHTAAAHSAETETVAFAYASQAANIFQPISSANAAEPMISNPFRKKSLSMTEVVSISKGDTLNKVFEAFEVPTEISMEAIKSLKGVFSPRSFRVGQQITLLFTPDEEGGRDFRGYRFAADPLRDVIIMDAEGTGKFDTTVIEKKLTNVTMAKQGVITGSLVGAAKRAGVPASVVQDMIRIYSFSVDFQRDLQEGDKFEVMYGAKVDDKGDVYGSGEMTYARLTLSGKDYPIYRYEDATGHVDYYKPDGTSNRRGLIKTPINGARMSSGFGMRRHPILGYSKMHKGVDFAAPTGTPIYAAGDGVILKAGWFGSYGKYVRISHAGALGTAYGHMSRIANGIRPGIRVKQGQVIGYVGTTGRSTGAHLHYEVLMNGGQMNPNSVKVPTSAQLAGKEMQKFKSQLGARQSEFKQALAKTSNQTASR
jgi:murein DD-endopeptidase MepM/ murein hydrolase activator NlpD